MGSNLKLKNLALTICEGFFYYIYNMRIYRYIYLFVLSVSVFFAYAQSVSSTNAKIKAVFIYNFTKYFEWNEFSRSSEFRIGILGDNKSLREELEKLALSKLAKNMPIKVIQFNSIDDITYTEMLYVDLAKNPQYRIDKRTKNTLVISENDKDLNKVMIAFVMDGNRQKFALNEVTINKAGLKVNSELKSLAIVISGTDKKADEKKIQEWSSVFDKFSDAIKNNSSEIKLSKKEAAEVLATIDANKKTLSEKEEKLYDQKVELISLSEKLTDQEDEIKIQQKNLVAQKNKIDEQLKSILTQEQKLKLQEEKLELTVLQNKIQEADLEIAKQEVALQQEKIRKQKESLQLQEQKITLAKSKLGVLNEKVNSQKTILYLAAFLVLIIAVALFIAYRGNKNKQRANALLSRQKVEIEHQRELVEEKQKEILDSINYAKRIQYSLLASDKLLKDNLPNHFLFFKPKDVVSGDFYWGLKLNGGNFILVTADSTGHGVPGSIMSMLNISCLNEAINADKLTQPSDILNATRKKIINHLSNDGSQEGGKDGMDCSLVSFDFKNKKIIYAAANNPVWIIRDKAFIALTADRMPVGKHDKDTIPFTQHEFDLQSGDMVYTLTDGFPDQFGGPKGKKFKYKQLEELLLSIAHESMESQKQKLEEVFENWKGNLEQVDDVCVIGVRV